MGYWVPNLEKLMKKMEEDGGIMLKDIAKDQYLEVHTKNFIYTLAVIDANQYKVAVQSNGKYFKKTEIAYLNGSTFGGSMIRLAWVGVNMYLEFSRLSGEDRCITTTAIAAIKIKQDPAKVKQLIDSAVPPA